MKKRSNKMLILQGARSLLQIIFFIFLPALYIQALNGVKQIYLAIINQSVTTALLPQMIEVIALIPITLLFGRFFCGWMCGFGSFTDFIYFISSKIFKKKIKMSKQVDSILKYVKYLVLASIIGIVWSLNLTVFNTTSPWDVFGMVATIGKMPDMTYVISNLLAGFLIFVCIVIASTFIERFFCRYLCPMGAVFAIVSKLRIGKILKPRQDCGKCRICTTNCPMGISLNETDIVSSAECINCMKCVSVCPSHNTTYTMEQNNLRPLLASLIAVAVMTGSYYLTDFLVNSSGSNISLTVQADELTTTNTVLYNDGTYEGTGTGYRGGTTMISVTIENDTIINISTVSPQDDDPYYERSFATISQDIVDGQSTEVDTVSGATFSSDGIIEAITDALSQAKIVEASTDDTTLSTITTTQDQTMETATQTPTTQAPATQAPATQTPTTQVPATQTPTTEPTIETSGQYIDGTYSGSGTGFRRGTTTVTVEVSGGKITSINVDSYEDDRPYFNEAFSSVSEDIIASQSTNVDGVSGATFSSDGIMEAVSDALSGATK